MRYVYWDGVIEANCWIAGVDCTCISRRVNLCSKIIDSISVQAR